MQFRIIRGCIFFWKLTFVAASLDVASVVDDHKGQSGITCLVKCSTYTCVEVDAIKFAALALVAGATILLSRKCKI